MTMHRMHCCTWARSPTSPELALLKASAQRVGLEPTVLPCSGFLDKPIKLRDFAAKLPDDDLLLFTDGYDVLYSKPEAEILARFSALDSPLVFSGEEGCYHHLTAARDHFAQAAGREPYPYLNSGLGMGFVGAVLEMLDAVLASSDEVRRQFELASDTRGFFNDQTLYGHYASRHPEQVRIDTRAELFWTMASETFDVAHHAEVRPGEIKQLNGETRPCLVHVPHRQKSYLPYLQVADLLGLPLTRREVDVELAGRLLDSGSERSSPKRVVGSPDVRQRLEALRAKAPKPVRLFRDAQAPMQKCESIAVLFIGTGRYLEFFEEFYESSRELLLPDTPKSFWVFTDQVRHPSLRSGSGDVILVETEAEPWPLSTLLRFRYLNRVRDQLVDHSHIIYLDADMLVCSEITEEEFFAHSKPLFGVQHPGNLMHGNAPFERRPDSRARVGDETDRSMYWQGCLWGGRAEDVLDMSWTLARRIDDDLARDVIARWHDESHLNRYFAESRARVHTHHPGYAYPEKFAGELRVDRKILHLAKEKRRLRTVPQSSGDRTIGESPDGVLIVEDTSIPRRPEGLRLERAPDSFVILDADGEKLSQINETAAQIWRLCDGKTSVGELIRILSAVRFASPSDVGDRLRRFLGAFEHHGLIFIQREPPETERKPPEASADDESCQPICFFSFANNVNAGQLRELKASANDENVSICYLGDGLRRLPTTLKLDLLYDRVRQLDDDQIVCAVDAFDVFFCAGAEEIERKFLAMDCDCLFSAERAYSHQYPKYRRFYDGLLTQSPYRYLNSGSIIGYAHALKTICAPTLTTKLQPRVVTPRSISRIKGLSSRLARAFGFRSFDPNVIYSVVYYTDQQHYGKYVARNPRKLRIALDHETELFWNTALEWRDIADHYRIEEGRIVNAHTGNAPSVIHVPGWRVHRKVLEHLAAVQASLVAARGNRR